MVIRSRDPITRRAISVFIPDDFIIFNHESLVTAIARIIILGLLLKA